MLSDLVSGRLRHRQLHDLYSVDGAGRPAVLTMQTKFTQISSWRIAPTFCTRFLSEIIFPLVIHIIVHMSTGFVPFNHSCPFLVFSPFLSCFRQRISSKLFSIHKLIWKKLEGWKLKEIIWRNWKKINIQKKNVLENMIFELKIRIFRKWTLKNDSLSVWISTIPLIFSLPFTRKLNKSALKLNNYVVLWKK